MDGQRKMPMSEQFHYKDLNETMCVCGCVSQVTSVGIYWQKSPLFAWTLTYFAISKTVPRFRCLEFEKKKKKSVQPFVQHPFNARCFA